MKTIPLTQGKHAMVDDVDYDFLNQWKWRVLKAKRKKTKQVWYAHRTTQRPNRKPVYMHREVLIRSGCLKFKECDHFDDDGLNNTRQNLRAATSSQNKSNMRKRIGCTSRFKGVYWHNKRKKWMAKISCLGKSYWLGVFKNEKDAAKAYDYAALRHFGEFARLNCK